MSAYLFDTLLELGVHLGHINLFSNKKSNYFILGKKNQFNIIDIRHTVFFLRKSLLFLKSVGKSQGSLLFYSGALATSNQVIKLYFFNLLGNDNHSFFDEKWSFGQLTNFKIQARKLLYKLYFIQSFTRKKKITKQYLYFRELKWMDILTRLVFYTYYKQVTGVSWDSHFLRMLKYWRFFIFFKFFKNMLIYPDIFILINTQNYRAPTTEASSLRIPVIGLVDTNSHLSGISYPIPSNDDSALISIFFFKLFLNTYLIGKSDIYRIS